MDDMIINNQYDFAAVFGFSGELATVGTVTFCSRRINSTSVIKAFSAVRTVESCPSNNFWAAMTVLSLNTFLQT
jgi:hypothetical protein